MQTRWFEDFAVGDRFRSQRFTVTESMIIDFAILYDPQPFHVDIEAANASMYGGLIASGYQTMALTFRLAWQTGVFQESNLGAHGLDEVRWPRPVRAGDTIRVEFEVVEVRPSRSRPDRGTVRMAYATYNQRDEVVMTLSAPQIVACRTVSV